MNKQISKKTGVALLITLCMMLSMVTPAQAATAYEYHPEVKAYGTVEKDIYVDRNIFDYEDDDGLTSNLPYDRQQNNLTITFENIVWETPFFNQTVSKASDESSAQMQATSQVLSIDGQDYIVVTGINTSAVTGTGSYGFRDELTTPEDNRKTVTNEDYIITTAKSVVETGDSTNSYAEIKYTFIDVGGTERVIDIVLWNTTGSNTVNVQSDTYLRFYYYANGNDYETVQLKIQDVITAGSKSWELSKLKSISYGGAVKVAATPSASYEVKAYFKLAQISSDKICLDDETEDGALINGTSTSYTYDSGEVIGIKGLTAEKVKDVSINYVYEDIDYEVVYSEGFEGFNYEWTFNHPTTEESSADDLTYSSQNITLRSWFDGSYYTLASSRGSDFLDDIDQKTVSTTASTVMDDRAWSYGVESSITEDTDYLIKLRAENLPSTVIDALTEYPTGGGGVWGDDSGSFWDYVRYKFWASMSVLASFLGVGVAFTNSKLRGSRRAVRWLEFASPMMPMPLIEASMPVMMGGRKSSGKGSKVSDLTQLLSVLLFLASIGLYFYGYFYPASVVGGMSQFTLALPAIVGYALIVWDSEY